MIHEARYTDIISPYYSQCRKRVQLSKPTPRGHVGGIEGQLHSFLPLPLDGKGQHFPIFFFLLLYMSRLLYSVYCLCVNVYCTAATGCQTNCSLKKINNNNNNSVFITVTACFLSTKLEIGSYVMFLLHG
jgi:hypothetical protein